MCVQIQKFCPYFFVFILVDYCDIYWRMMIVFFKPFHRQRMKCVIKIAFCPIDHLENNGIQVNAFIGQIIVFCFFVQLAKKVFENPYAFHKL